MPRAKTLHWTGERMLRKPRGSLDGTRRIGEALAARIACDLRAGLGTVNEAKPLGREKELGARYGVSRGTMRGAIRELERQGVARMKQGRRGGLYPVSSNISEPARALTDHLLVTDASVDEVAEFAMWLYRFAVHAASVGAEIDGEALAEAVSLAVPPQDGFGNLDRWCAMRFALVRAAGNRALNYLYAAVFMAYHDTLAAELNLGPLEEPRSRALWLQEQKVICAAAARDAAFADLAAQACTQLEKDYVRHTLAAGMLSKSLRPETLYRSNAAGLKLAHQTIRALHHEIRTSSIAAGEPVGSIKELAERFGVSMEVMRDALLLGQKLGLVTTRRGRGGGVFAAGCNRDRVVRGAASHLCDTADEMEIRIVLAALVATERRGGVAELAFDILKNAVPDHSLQ
jgi:DNA-binding FadR family transcriptional regulator